MPHRRTSFECSSMRLISLNSTRLFAKFGRNLLPPTIHASWNVYWAHVGYLLPLFAPSQSGSTLTEEPLSSSLRRRVEPTKSSSHRHHQCVPNKNRVSDERVRSEADRLRGDSTSIPNLKARRRAAYAHRLPAECLDSLSWTAPKAVSRWYLLLKTVYFSLLFCFTVTLAVCFLISTTWKVVDKRRDCVYRKKGSSVRTVKTPV